MVRVVARVNPPGDVAEIFQAEGEPLRLLIHEVTDEIRGRADFQRMAAAMASQPGSRTDPSVMTPGLGVAASAQALATRPAMTRGRTRHTLMSSTETERTVIERQSYGRTPLVLGAGGRAETYPQIARGLGEIMETGGPGGRPISSRELARGFASYVRTGEAGVLAPHVDRLNQLQLLMFGTEVRRNPATLAFAPMTLQLIARGDMTWGEAFGGRTRPYGGGAFPMSMEDAEGAARELAVERATGASPAGRSPAARELARREIGVAERWIRAQMRVERPSFVNRDAAKRFVKERILAFYGLRP